LPVRDGPRPRGRPRHGPGSPPRRVPGSGGRAGATAHIRGRCAASGHKQIPALGVQPQSPVV
jgi:hypothetical protein